MFPSISANSPRLCVATAQAVSHSSVRSGGVIFAATATDFSAHARALLTRPDRDIGGCPRVGGGSCCARDMERLFTQQKSVSPHTNVGCRTYSIQRCGSCSKATWLRLGGIKGQLGSVDSSLRNGGQALQSTLVLASSHGYSY